MWKHYLYLRQKASSECQDLRRAIFWDFYWWVSELSPRRVIEYTIYGRTLLWRIAYNEADPWNRPFVTMSQTVRVWTFNLLISLNYCYVQIVCTNKYALLYCLLTIRVLHKGEDNLVHIFLMHLTFYITTQVKWSLVQYTTYM